MMRARTSVIVVGAVGTWLGVEAAAAPVPSLAPKSWELRFDFGDPQTITVQMPGYDKPQTFWYMLYTVTNTSGQEVQFLPRFELMTNTMQVLQGNPGIHPFVLQAIKRRHRPTHPLLVEPVKVMGRLLQGPDNAKSSVAIWPQIGVRANQFTVYVAGLSGESVLVRNPNHKRDKDEYLTKKLDDGTEIRMLVNPKFFTLRKTLAIRYILPGDEQTRMTAKAGRLGKEWIMK
jgi:hypothetical protein